MNSNKFNLYIVCIIILILDGAHSLITLMYLPGLRSMLALLTMCFFLLIYPINKRMLKVAIFVYLFLVVGEIVSNRGDVIISFLTRLPILTLFLLSREKLRIVSDRIGRFFFIIISISLILYVFANLLNAPLPYEKINYNQYSLKNYLFIYTNSLTYGIKYSGFTVEPGYMSLLCICLLALNEFKFNKFSSYVYVLAILFSLSLEGYVLLVLGIIISSMCRESRLSLTIKYTFFTVGILFVCIYTAFHYNDGNNVVSEYIFERLVFDDEIGVVGNNRESLGASFLVDQVFFSDSVWLGIGKKKYMELVADLDICSWRQFVLMYGAIYSILLLFITILGLRMTVYSKTIPFFLIYWADFFPHGGPFYEVMYFLTIILLLNMKEDYLTR